MGATLAHLYVIDYCVDRNEAEFQHTSIDLAYAKPSEMASEKFPVNKLKDKWAWGEDTVIRILFVPMINRRPKVLKLSEPPVPHYQSFLVRTSGYELEERPYRIDFIENRPELGLNQSESKHIFISDLLTKIPTERLHTLSAGTQLIRAAYEPNFSLLSANNLYLLETDEQRGIWAFVQQKLAGKRAVNYSVIELCQDEVLALPHEANALPITCFEPSSFAQLERLISLASPGNLVLPDAAQLPEVSADSVHNRLIDSIQSSLFKHADLEFQILSILLCWFVATQPSDATFADLVGNAWLALALSQIDNIENKLSKEERQDLHRAATRAREQAIGLDFESDGSSESDSE